MSARKLQLVSLFAVAVVAFAVPRAALAVGEQTGRIKGLITEATSGSPLGGIDITVAGPTLIGGPRTIQANEDGTYELADLPPGP
jgi:hypothetical protein